MKTFYKSYLKAFDNYAQAKLDNISSIKRISRYARMLTLKANQLLRRATLNTIVNIQQMSKELFESGKEFVRKFALKLKGSAESKDPIT